LFLLPVAALAESPSSLEERFRLADRDRDGALSAAEAGQANWFVEQMDRFQSLDADGSGTVTLVEIGAAISMQVQEWMEADTDGDGRISSAEAKARSGSVGDVFRRADNGDGTVTRDELENFSQRSYYEHGDLPSVAPNIFEKRF
jgi:Ca2+-binding EF-hand superfamily protein